MGFYSADAPTVTEANSNRPGEPNRECGVSVSLGSRSACHVVFPLSHSTARKLDSSSQLDRLQHRAIHVGATRKSRTDMGFRVFAGSIAPRHFDHLRPIAVTFDRQLTPDWATEPGQQEPRRPTASWWGVPPLRSHVTSWDTPDQGTGNRWSSGLRTSFPVWFAAPVRCPTSPTSVPVSRTNGSVRRTNAASNVAISSCWL